MDYRITGLSPDEFQHLFSMSDEELARLSAKRYTVDHKPGFPDRIEMCDAEIGESVLLVNHLYQPGDSPYRARHAIFVREGAQTRYDRVNEIPGVMRLRLLSLRGFDKDHMIVDADVVDGQEMEPLIHKLLANPDIEYIQVHNAKRGCYSGRIERA